MVDVVGDETVDGKDFVDVLDTGLDAFDLAITPPTVDQVLVGSVDRTRGVRSRAVILLGMNDDQFPRLSKEDSILSDSERTTMRQHRVDLDPDTEPRPAGRTIARIYRLHARFRASLPHARHRR